MTRVYGYLFLLFSVLANAQVINIPDAVLKAKLISARDGGLMSPYNIASPNESGNGNYLKIDANSDGEIDIVEAAAVKWLSIYNSHITSLEGLQYFSNLATLIAYSNQITSYTPMPTLKKILVDYNQLTSFDVSNCPLLTELHIQVNQLSSLDVTHNPLLNFLNVRANRLTTIDVSQNPLLRSLNIEENRFAIQPNFTNPPALNLKDLYCGDNLFIFNTALVPSNIETLSCSYLRLVNTDFSGFTTLKSLDCSYNSLTSLHVNSPYLTSLYGNDNLLTSINFGSGRVLQYLHLENNKLTNLDLSGQVNTISSTTVYVNNNPNLTSLNIENGTMTMFTIPGLSYDVNSLTDGNPNLRYICADAGEETTKLQAVIAEGNSNIRIADYCSFAPGGAVYEMSGTSRYDNNTNGCDASDNVVPEVKFNIIKDGVSTAFIADNTGAYNTALASGNTTIAPELENPGYFTISPTTATVNLSDTNAPYTQHFCVAPNGTHPDVEIVLVPINPARPGFLSNYKIIYKNKGTETASGVLQFIFDDAIMNFISASPIYNSTGLNQLSWNYANLKPFESREIELRFLMNTPTATPPLQNGMVLTFNASIATVQTDETPLDNIAVLRQTVVGSFDPNDKRCLEGTSVSQNVIGKYVHYMIRFENTGTFAAQNIAIRDIINTTKFDINSLIPLSGSHPYTTKISNGNKVEFFFENINLPFDDANNDGYVVFKIKTKSDLVVGNSFSNQANIYFDYNFPIVTNNATTTIETLAANDFEFSTYFTLYPNPAGETLNIKTKENIKISSLNIYDISGRLVQTISNPETNLGIDVSSLKTGNYFLKINSDNGTTNAKFAKK